MCAVITRSDRLAQKEFRLHASLFRLAHRSLLILGFALSMLLFCERSPAITFTRLFSFGADQTKGYGPNSALFQGTDGNFYGTCYGAGQPLPAVLATGTIFRLTPGGDVTPVFTFHGSDGREPNGVIQATDGNLYGTTDQEGPAGGGTVFQVTLGGTRTTLFSFAQYSANGGQPMAPLIQGKDGNLYGTALYGGDGVGTIFRISTTGSFTRLHSFNIDEGGYPRGKLIEDDAGNLYGTTSVGGEHIGGGTVFKLAPAGTYTVLHAFSDRVGEIARAIGNQGEEEERAGKEQNDSEYFVPGAVLC